MLLTPKFLSDIYEVLTLFLIPIGGGIPAGVIVAKNHEFGWALTAFIYLVSDLILACVFEIVMLLAIQKSKTSAFLTRFFLTYRQMLERSGVNFGLKLNPFALIMLSFGLDPMTGRVIAKSAGHGFLTGWAIAITGDLIFFTLIMISTLLLNDILGNGFWAACIITAAMLGLPALFKLMKRKKAE